MTPKKEDSAVNTESFTELHAELEEVDSLLEELETLKKLYRQRLNEKEMLNAAKAIVHRMKTKNFF